MFLFELMVGIAEIINAFVAVVLIAMFVGALAGSVFYLLTGQLLF